MELPTNNRLSVGRVISLIVVGVAMFVVGFGLRGLIISSQTNVQLLSSVTKEEEPPINPYPVYSFSQLRQLTLTPEPITFLKSIEETPDYHAFLVSWNVPNLTSQKSERVTAQMNIPSGKGPFPVLILLRGYVEKEQYFTGLGTRKAAAEFAKNGYITIAPDFLGYGGSDAESSDILLARFSRPVTVLQLLKDLESPRFVKESSEPSTPQIEFDQEALKAALDPTKIGIWAHSNGGQIALSVLEITSRVLPTTLWAPVSKPFPYSVLAFSDELPDGGAYLRSQIFQFEFVLKNSPQDFSILSEPARILAPIQIHQGMKDDAVPTEWSQQLAEKLEAATVSAELLLYPNADHNLQPDWTTVVQRDLQFFSQHIKQK